MSVDRSDYIILGYRLPYEFCKQYKLHENEKFSRMLGIHPDEKFVLVVDGMSGEYVVFGELIEKADEYNGFEFNELPHILPGKQLDAVSEKFLELFGYDALSLLDSHVPKLLIFTHWS